MILNMKTNPYYNIAKRMIEQGELVSVRQAVLDICETEIWADATHVELGVREAWKEHKIKKETI